MKIVDAIVGQPKGWMYFEALLWIFAVAILDTFTPREVRLFTFYAVPIFVISFRFGQRDGIALAVLCDVVSWVADRFTPSYIPSVPMQGPLASSWSLLNRLVAFVFVATCGAYLCRIR